MVAEHGGESLCRFHSRHHPKCVTEDVAVAFVSKGIHTLFICLGEQIEEVFNVGAVDKLAAVVGAEELAEVEGDVFVGELAHQTSEVVGVDV